MSAVSNYLNSPFRHDILDVNTRLLSYLWHTSIYFYCSLPGSQKEERELRYIYIYTYKHIIKIGIPVRFCGLYMNCKNVAFDIWYICQRVSIGTHSRAGTKRDWKILYKHLQEGSSHKIIQMHHSKLLQRRLDGFVMTCTYTVRRIFSYIFALACSTPAGLGGGR